MNILITGGSGFLGSKLARTLLARGHLGGKSITHMTLADQFPLPTDLAANPSVTGLVGSLLSQCETLKEQSFDAVFHLASAVSGECEADFDLGLRSNLDSTRALLDALRYRFNASGHKAKLIFSSSGGIFGSDPARPMPKVITDETYPMPQSSYGTHKFMLEQLVADYSRKGYIEGRSVRLMTVAVRPGKPNGAASSFFSGIIREPIAGIASSYPVPLSTRHGISSPNNTVDGIIKVFEATAQQFGGRMALNMPALSVTVGEMLDALQTICGDKVRALVTHQPDPLVEKIVLGWPTHWENKRSLAMGLQADENFESIIKQYLESKS
ncbi:MAG: NAD-dependent epimerase/dehydratase family protein [Cytophagales bacterium]|nr:NAD-dependent epimerase/dehydratase family protein [Cytophagales bacterium]